MKVDGRALVDVKHPAGGPGADRRHRARLTLRRHRRRRHARRQHRAGHRLGAGAAGDPRGPLFSDDALVEAERRVFAMGVFATARVRPGEPDEATGRIAVTRRPCAKAPFRTLSLGGGARFDAIRNEVRLISEWTNRNFLGGTRRLTAHAEAGWAFIPNAYAALSERPGHGAAQRTDRALAPRVRAAAFPRASVAARAQRAGVQPHAGADVHRDQRPLHDRRRLAGAVDAVGVSVLPPGGRLPAAVRRSAAPRPRRSRSAARATDDTCLVWLSYLDALFAWDRRDNSLEPRKGTYVSLSLQQGGGPLGGDFDYVRAVARRARLLQLRRRRRADAVGAAARRRARPWSGNPDDSAVVTRFYAGGGVSMRGFDDRRLSPLLLARRPTATPTC